MLRLASCAALLCAIAGAPMLPAQGPMRPPPLATEGGAPLARSAEFLLAHTGELELSDAQVVKLAGIARRAADRRRAMRASVDSLRRNMRARAERDSSDGVRDGRGEQMRTHFAQLRAQMHADRRDAIAVLTPDQQATAWELIASRGGMMRARMSRGEWHGGRSFGDRHRRQRGMPGLERRRGGPPAGAPGQPPPADDSSR